MPSTLSVSPTFARSSPRRSTAIVVRCRVRDTDRVGQALTALGWGTQWIDEPLVQDTDDDGYVLHAPDPDAALRGKFRY